jgi:tripartite-type tricarboxylate transporter receptor subunit TctC
MKPINLQRRRWVAGAAVSTALPLSASMSKAFAAGNSSAGVKFPTRPITLIVPWPAAGATDFSMRILAEHAGKILGQNVIVQNKPGASGTLGMNSLQNAAPDGYTLSQLPQTIYRTPYIQKVSWDPIRDVTHIIQVSGNTFGVLVPTDSPFKTLDDLFAFAAKNPGQLSIATNGIGTTAHIVMDELFGRKNMQYTHVPYKGTAELLFALSAGQIMVGVNSTGFAPSLETGKLRLLATFAEGRSKKWPEVPTLKELGYGIVAMSPYGIGGPANMPSEIVTVLHDAFKAAMFNPHHTTELARYDQELNYLGTEAYSRAAKEFFAQEKLLTERLGLARSQ